MTSSNTSSVDSKNIALKDLQVWQLEEATANFSEVVQLAQDAQPQLVTDSGENDVVVMSATQFAKLLPFLKEPNIHQLFSQSPLSRLDFETQSVPMPFRETEL